MKKKISILTLVFVFLVSTTGMPLIIHYCKMMETASLQACEMHSKELKKSSCCESESQPQAIADSYFSKAIDECCTDYLVDYSVKETFLTSKTEIDLPLYLYTLIPVDFNLTSNYQTNQEIDTSPHSLLSNRIYLTNSVLLI
jgi:hypothetical protein